MMRSGPFRRSAASAALPLLALLVLPVLAGCGDGAVARPPGPPTPLKEYSAMTKEEKIEFIKKTPMPEEAKQKQIAAINAGTDR